MKVSGLRVLVVGLGRFGGGVGAVRWLAGQGAIVKVTDLADAAQLRDSIRQLAGLDLTWTLGRHDPSDLEWADLVVLNPAVNKSQSSFFRRIIELGVPCTTEMNLFCGLCPAPIIAVTGTYGKSTTCEMLAGVLRASLGLTGPRFTGVHLGGNIGRSLLPELHNIRQTDCVILEISNAQLEDLPMIRWEPLLAVITNLSPHHLNRHATYEEYLRAKLNIVGSADCSHPIVVGDVDAAAKDHLYNAVHGRRDRIIPVGQPSPPVELAVRGAHNLTNAACVLTVCRHFGIDERLARVALRAFVGLPHRLQFVRSINGVDYYNDSKSTSPRALTRAVESFDAPIIAIVGGQVLPGESSDPSCPPALLQPCVESSPRPVAAHSSSPPPGVRQDCAFQPGSLEDCMRIVAGRSRAVICIGASGPIYAAALSRTAGRTPPCEISKADTLEQALSTARDLARPGDVVLFSPGAPSFDRYPNFAVRGQHFMDLVNAL